MSESNETHSTPASERVREAYETLPGHETGIDYPQMQLANPFPFGLDPVASVSLVIATPDGRRITIEESMEYRRDAEGEVENFEFEDVQFLLDRVVETAQARVDQ